VNRYNPSGPLIGLLSVWLFASSAVAELTIDSVYPTLGKLGDSLDVTITGTGFDTNTRLSLYLDSGNARFIKGNVDIAGIASDVAIKGDSVFVTHGYGLIAIDISTPAEAVIVGEIETEVWTTAVEIEANYAFVAAGDDENTEEAAGIQVIDISDPKNMVISGFLATTGIAKEIKIIGDVAYAINSCFRNLDNECEIGSVSSLLTIDISTPDEPVLVGTLILDGIANDLAVDGSHAYVAAGCSGVHIVNVKNISNPEMVKTIDTGNCPSAIDATDKTLFVTDVWDGLAIFNVETPTSPISLATIDTPGHAQGVKVVGNRAYVSDTVAGLRIIDISSTSNPKFVGVVDTPGDVVGVNILGDLAYVADTGKGLQIVDIVAPVSSPTLGFVDTLGEALEIDIVDNHAYVVDWSYGLQVVDVSASNDPVLIGSEKGSIGLTYAVDVVGDFAYLAAGVDGLVLLDISSPDNPVLAGDGIETNGEAQSVVVEGNTAYIGTDVSLQIIDVNSIFDINIIGELAMPDVVKAMAVVDDIVYVANGDAGLQIVDISTPANPIAIGGLATNGTAHDLAVVDGIAYVANWDFFGLQIIDVSDPENPVTIASVETADVTQSISVVGNMAYIASFGAGIEVYDISIPSNPVKIGLTDTPGFTEAIEVVGNNVYVADGDGLVIAALPIEVLPLTTQSSTSLAATLPSPVLAGNYTLRVFNDNEFHELSGAITFANGLSTFSNPESDTGSVPDPLPDPDVNATSKAIILAGGGPYPGNNLWEATINSANFAYKALIYQGYTRENIKFLSPDLNIDSDGDGVFNDIDGQATLADLEDAILNWSTDSAAPAYELLVYVVDHGGDAQFRLNETTVLAAAELDSWLDELQQSMPGKLMVVYDACQSGTFIPLLLPPEGKERIVITSAGDENAFFVNQGVLSFSYQFWASVLTGGNLYDSYLIGRNMMQDFQTAQLDADGDGIANEKTDSSNVQNLVIGRGYIPASDKPLVSAVSASQTLTGTTTATISAWGIIDVTGIERVWGVITPPDFTVASLDTPVTDMPTVELTDTDGDNIWEGVYDNYDVVGTYDITIYAMNKSGFYSAPSDSFPNRTTITQMGASNVTDTDGDGLPDDLDIDDDNDGVNDNADVFPLNFAEQFDTDGDGVGDNSDPDADLDFSIDTSVEAPITGLWWNSGESGWGVTLTQQYGVIFVTLFTYDSDGLPVWYVASNCVISVKQCQGDLFKVTGGKAIFFNWNGDALNVADVGEINISFQGNSNALMSVTIDGISAQKLITRQEFSTLSPGASMSALWWNASESTQQTNIAFVTLFTYDSNGAPTWYVASNCAVQGDSCSGLLYRVTGGSEITAEWNAGNQSVEEIGNVSFEFSSEDTGTMSYDINGINGSKDISKQIWATSSN
jgi:hypothetical protein